MPRARFYGRITGAGSASGVRIVVGDWRTTPMGAFSDVMIEDARGHRTLLAPNAEVADLIESTYVFDEVQITPVEVELRRSRLLVSSADLEVEMHLGLRTPLGHLLRLQPRALATSPAWCRALDPVARTLLTGVRTAGVARPGRRECYGAVDMRAVTALTGQWAGRSLGTLAPVAPPVRFGFGSTPAAPSMTTVVTTIVTTD